LSWKGVVCTSKVVAGGKRQIMALHIQGDGPTCTASTSAPGQRHLGHHRLPLAFMAHKDLRALNREHPRSGEDLWRTTWWRAPSTASGWSMWASARP
jgi:hypothetical protein